MSEYLRLAKKKVGEGKSSSVGLYLTARLAQAITALALVSIADSLERLADKLAPACEDGYDAVEENEF